MASNRKEQPQPDKKQNTFNKLDEAYAESSMEDQLVVYWNRHKTQVLAGVIIALFAIVGLQVTKWLSAKSAADRGAAYAAATEDADKLAFGEEYSKTDLGGVAFLELADKSYADGDFAAALPNYEKAFQAFSRYEFKQTAHLGLALTRLQSGDESSAIKDLEAIAANADYVDSIRAEALYHLSILDWKNSAFEAMFQRHEQIEALPNSGNWQAKAVQLQGSIPELKQLVDARAPAELIVEN